MKPQFWKIIKVCEITSSDSKWSFSCIQNCTVFRSFRTWLSKRSDYLCMILISRHSIWKTGSQRLNFAIFCDLESDKSLKCRHHSENRKSEPWRKLFINAHFELNVYFSLFSWIVFSYSEEYWFVMAAFLYERKKYCICKRDGGLVQPCLPSNQKVPGSNLRMCAEYFTSTYFNQSEWIRSRRAVVRDRN